ncbi:MAG: autotransporter outer membrane beta-barrel domain-containing protein, partial [Gammaproteobacteria bacterium]|nr:autotransporter outer membrane beta-barrel domain-containing protein [Gammaproteobacteria bacterium]
ETAAADFAATTGSIMFPTATTFTIAIADDDATAPDEAAESFTVTLTAPDTASQITGAGVTTTIGQDDDPSARATRVKTPLATSAKAATHLTAQALSQRLRLNGADTFVSPTNFSLAHSGDGINLWAAAGRTNADGNDNNVTYNGDTTALHLGADTTWNDGLLGITIAQSAGDTNFTANDVSSTLKTSLLSIHPYLTRTVNNRKLWATAGYGTGEAQLRENNTMTADTGLSLLSAAIGLTLAESDNASFHLGGQWSRAQLDSATFPTGQVLPKVTATAFRLTGGTEFSKQLGNWRPFLTVSIRSDSGDGDDGNGADYGAGIEWQTGNAHLRLAGRKHAQGKGPDEENLTLTARKTAGRLNLGLNLTAASGLNTADLLSGELRF